MRSSFVKKYLEEGLSIEAIKILQLRRKILKKLDRTPQRFKPPKEQ